MKYKNNLFSNRLCVFGIILIAAFVLVVTVAPFIIDNSPFEQNLQKRMLPPSSEHWFGTDDLGRDVFARVVYGGRVSLLVGLVAVSVSITIGTFFGIISGYFGGIIDLVIMRFVDVILCFPTFFLILMVLAFWEPGIFKVMIVIGLTSWPGTARLVRSECLTVREREYILAAELLGLSKIRIFLRHLLPNVAGPIFIAATLGIGSSILIESGLSFLGLGVQPPKPSWGNILMIGKDYLDCGWWLSVFPGIAILGTVLSYNLLGEGLRDILDPRSLKNK